MTEFKVVLFDLGSTLIYSKDPWPPIYERADRELMEVLQQSGIPLEIKPFSSKLETFLDSYYASRTSPIEKTTFSVLKEILEQKGYRDTPASVLRTALDAMYAITQQNWYIEPDAIPALQTLREQGYRLGIVSNTSDDQNVQKLVDRWELRPFFETIITSAGFGIRKPDRRIFQLALNYFGVAPGQIVMVGDTIEADILGANQMGFYSIWITRRAQIPEEGELAIQPQAVISTLKEIPDLLADIQDNSE
ncbi:MAG TPA: HAD family hydrolase [Anaerolineales bacterium]